MKNSYPPSEIQAEKWVALGAGRPRTIEDPKPLRCEICGHQMREVGAYASQHRISIAEAVRRLLQTGLNYDKEKDTKETK